MFDEEPLRGTARRGDRSLCEIERDREMPIGSDRIGSDEASFKCEAASDTRNLHLLAACVVLLRSGV